MRSLLFTLGVACALAIGPVAAAQDDAPTGVVIELVEAGTSPQPLRHHFVAGQTQSVRLRVQSQMRMALGSRVQMVPMPIIRMDLRFGPTSVEGGHLHYRYEIIGVGATGSEREDVNERINTQVQALVGSYGNIEVDDRGQVVDFSFELPDGAPRELQGQSRMLRDSLGQMLPRFPAEPVGVGGSWRVIDDFSLPNMSVRVATTYRIASRNGDRLELDVSSAVVEGAPNPAQIDISGSGRLRYEIGTLRMLGRVQTVSAAEIRGPQGPMRMRVRSRMQITPL